jgi:hypothetical protein
MKPAAVVAGVSPVKSVACLLNLPKACSLLAKTFGVRRLAVTDFITPAFTLDLYTTALLPPSHSRLRATDRGECKNISP